MGIWGLLPMGCGAAAVDDGGMEATPGPKSPRLLVWITAGIIVLLVAVSITVAISQPAEFEPGSPEAVVQSYIQAVLDGDGEAAWNLLTPDLQRRCSPADLDDHYGRGGSRTVVLIETDIDGDIARVDLEFTTSYGDDPFDVSEYTNREQARLRLVDNEWRISMAPWPYIAIRRCS